MAFFLLWIRVLKMAGKMEESNQVPATPMILVATLHHFSGCIDLTPDIKGKAVENSHWIFAPSVTAKQVKLKCRFVSSAWQHVTEGDWPPCQSWSELRWSCPGSPGSLCAWSQSAVCIQQTNVKHIKYTYNYIHVPKRKQHTHTHIHTHTHTHTHTHKTHTCTHTTAYMYRLEITILLGWVLSTNT